MNGSLRGGIASLSARGIARCHGLVRSIFDVAIQYARDRKVAREAKRDLGLSGQKLTDEMERQMTERFSRSRSFRS